MSDNLVSITSKLPSKCLLYGIDPKSTPDQIQIRTFKGRDEKLIAEINSTNFDHKFQTILRGVLKGIDPAKLTIGDRLYILLWETINSYAKDFTIEHECEHCWQKSQYEVDLSLLENVELPSTFQEPYEIKLPTCGDKVKLRLLRSEDLIKIEEMSKQGSVWLYRYALSIVNDKSMADNIVYLEDLNSKDFQYIRAFHDKFAHGPKMEVNYKCPKCGGTGVMPVPFRLEMLLPFGEELKRHTGDAI